MKTLTLIVATGALLAAFAPTAGARNSLQCSISVKHTTAVHMVAPASPNGFPVRRNLMYIGTWHPTLTAKGCKTLQTAKPSTRTATNVSQVARDSL